ncbi:MAG: IS110 family transposase, partial [Planctomycetota bacterium]|nr:IS110 family transposase [Planctomycetota bacterium]
MPRKKRPQPQNGAPDFETLTLKNQNAAGIDLGSKSHFVAVPSGRDKENVREFGCYSANLREMGEWLRSCGIDTVAMESTGVYWVPVFEILEGEFGFHVILVSPRYAKNIPGKKSDVKDCQWIRTLHSYGLLPASFRPADEICQVRKHWRHRARLVEDASQQVLRMQKELEQMNVHLHKVVSDITGETGMKILKAILAGERDPVKLAQLKNYRVKKITDEIALSLSGNYRPEHVETLRDVLDTYEHLQRQIARVNARVEEALKPLHMRIDPEQKPLPKPKSKPSRNRNTPNFDVRTEIYRITGVDLTAVPSLSHGTILTVVTECGLNMSPWATENHFTSWMGLPPGLHKTGGKTQRRRGPKIINRAATALRVAAMSLEKSDSYLGAQYRRLKGRLGPQKAIRAMARKLAIIIYRALKYHQQYEDRGADYYQMRFREKATKFLKSKAQKLGLQ